MQDSQRRALIFSVLDDMKTNGEKVTAQKLATQAKMGKQTVLPHYREWQELEILGDSEEIELSQELVRVLKREITKEKFRQGEQLREVQDQLEEERDHYAAQSELWQQQIGELKEKLQSEESQNTELNKQNTALKEQEHEQRQKLSSLTDKLENAQSEVSKLEQRLAQDAKRAEEAQAEQERRLDASHNKILEHWMKALDEERREKSRLQKQAEKRELERTTLSKDKSRIENQFEHEKKNHRQTVEQLTTAEQKVSGLTEVQTIVDKLRHQLGQPEDLIETVLELQQKTGALAQSEHALTAKKAELQSSLESVATLTDTVKVLEKENRGLGEQVIRMEARLEGIQMAKTMNR